MNKITPKTIAIALYHLVVATIIFANIHPHLSLMGWDGIYPELNIPLNILRGLSAGWQEYYGAGLVGGHGFAATLPYTLVAGLLSLVLPQQLIRQSLVFLCYYLGGLGMLFVSEKVLRKLSDREHWTIACVASLFYLVNLGSMQTFYLPLEAFTVSFAALPWLTLFTIELLEKLSVKRILTFIAALFIASVQGFIPAVFVAYITSLAIFTGIVAVSHRTKTMWKRILVIWACVIAVNSYWLGPLAYFTLTDTHDYVRAYNNLTSTPEFVEKSIQYGSFANVMLLKSFNWDSVELGGPILKPWIDHFGIPVIPWIGYGMFALACTGVLYAFTRRKPVIWGLGISALYFFGNLAIDTPPFSWITQYVQSVSPALTQAFRTTFTKFGTGMSFYESLFLAIGLYAVSQLLNRQSLKQMGVLITVLGTVLLFVYGLPMWSQGLIYQKLFVAFPKQYTDAMTYINSLPDGRVADFPQDCPEGWYNSLWGYFGSGFLWYGVNKPVMARAFDVWSHNNENYYWELSTALRQQNYPLVENVLNKYDITYILYDQNYTHCRSQKGLTTSLDFRNYLDQSTSYIKLREFSGNSILPITIYARRQSDSSSYIQILTHAPAVHNIATYADTDPWYALNGPYISSNPQDTETNGLFSKRGDPIYPDLTTLTPVATASAFDSQPANCGLPITQQNDASAVTQLEQSGLRFITTDAGICRTITFTDIDTSRPYILSVTSRNLAGSPISLSVTNKGRPVGLDITLPVHTAYRTDYFVIPPTFPSEIEYTLMLQNSSYNRYSSINDVGSVRLFAIAGDSGSYATPSGSMVATNNISVYHPASFLYVVSRKPSSGTFLLVNQSFDLGWVAFSFPFTKIYPHVPVNNWANGWVLPADLNNGQTVIVLFLPQLTEYLGFVLLGAIVWTTVSGRLSGQSD